jgi:hypothetical protein
MYALFIVVLAVTCTWFLLFRISLKSEDDGKNIRVLKRKLTLLFSTSIALWMLWFGIREYWPPINVPEHWLSILIALVSMSFAISVSILVFSSQMRMRLGLAALNLFICGICLFSAIFSIPVS